MHRQTVYTAISILLVGCMVWVYFVLVDLARNPTRGFKWRLRVLLFLFLVPALYESLNGIGDSSPIRVWMNFAQILVLLLVFFFCLTTGAAYLGFQVSRIVRRMFSRRKATDAAVGGAVLEPGSGAATASTAGLAAPAAELSAPAPAAAVVEPDPVTPAVPTVVAATTGLAATASATVTVSASGTAAAPPVAAGLVDSNGVELSRRRWLRNACYGFAGVSALTGVGALWTESMGLQVNRVTLHCPGLPPAFQGYRIVQISDVHAGVYMGVEAMRVARETAEALNPDLIVFTGDQVDRNLVELVPFYNAFEGLRGKDGIYSILGNHDYLAGGREVRASLNAHGLPVLFNEHVRIVRGQQSLVVGGLDDLWHGKPDAVKAFAGTGPKDFRVCLVHNPNWWPKAAQTGANLTLAGHTHGGQINLIMDSLSPARLFSPYVQGVFRNEFQQQMFVSVGVGFVGIPVRIGVPAEIVEITLM